MIINEFFDTPTILVILMHSVLILLLTHIYKKKYCGEWSKTFSEFIENVVSLIVVAIAAVLAVYYYGDVYSYKLYGYVAVLFVTRFTMNMIYSSKSDKKSE